MADHHGIDTAGARQEVLLDGDIRGIGRESANDVLVSRLADCGREVGVIIGILEVAGASRCERPVIQGKELRGVLRTSNQIMQGDGVGPGRAVIGIGVQDGIEVGVAGAVGAHEKGAHAAGARDAGDRSRCAVTIKYVSVGANVHRKGASRGAATAKKLRLNKQTGRGA